MSLNFDLTGIPDFRTTCYDQRTDPPDEGRREEAAPCPECEGSCEIVGEGDDREAVCFDCDHRHTTFRVFMDCSPNPWSREPDEEGFYTRQSAVTFILIFKSMALDLGSITAENVDEWMLRLRLQAAFHGGEPGDLITTTEKTLPQITNAGAFDTHIDALHRGLAQYDTILLDGRAVAVAPDVNLDPDDHVCLTGKDADAVVRALADDPARITFRKTEGRALTRAEVEAHIGLTTNVATLTRPKWLTSMSKAHDRRREWAAA